MTDVDETHAVFALAISPKEVACSQCGACSCHPRKGRDIAEPCLKVPEVESEHPRGFTIDPSTVIEDEPLTIEEAAVMVGIDPDNPEAKPQHFIIDADGKFIPAGLEPGEASNLTPNPSTPFMSAGGGWCAPSDNFYPGLDLPEVTARRGGISFTGGPDLRNLYKKQSKKDLAKRVEVLQKLLDAERVRVRKLRKRNRRLFRLIEKGL